MSRSKPLPSLDNLIIRASAGTGKTFQLSNRYLALLRLGVPCESILATTFTRKAAGEILDRVIGRLAEAADNDEQLQELARFTGEAAWSREACLDTLQAMMQSLHRLRVSTLDSLFAQIARSFGLELGFPLGWQIVEDLFDARLRSRAIDAVLTSGDEAKLRTLVHLLTKGEASRSISQLIRDAVNEMYDLFQETPREAWCQVPRFKPLDATEFDAAVRQLQQADVPDKRMSTAREQDLARAQQGDWGEFLVKGLAAKVAQGEPYYYKKPIPEALVAIYQQLLAHVRAELIGRVASQTEATYDLLEMFHVEYQRLKTSYRALRFEDVTRRLANVGRNVDLGSLSFRLDARIDHLLLDEFQDTSPQQWRVIEPWAQRVTRTDGGTSFFCVGDIKQAIYGWRGGVAEIFDAIDRQLPGLKPQSLNVSFRSSPPVIEAVNRVFTRMPEHANLGRAENGVRGWSQRFVPHDTQRRGLPGYVELVAAPAAGEGRRQDEVTLQFAAQRIAQLVAQAPGCSVGVLLRKNDSVARVIYELRGLGVAASEEGGKPLSDSAAVTVVLSALRLADHPGDTVARFHLANSPLVSVLQLGDDRAGAAARRVSLEIRQALIRDGYGATIQAWTRALAPHCNRRDLSRLEQLVEEAYAYDAAATLRAGDFAAHIENTRVPDPTAADVRVMTIHQAKGLQFDIVVLPELEGHLIGQNAAVVTHRPEVTAQVDRVCRYAGAEIQALLPAAFQQMFAAATDRAVTESLCVLYVALTRAIHAWYAIIPPSADSERNLPCTQAGLLRAALADGARAEPSSVLYAHGDPAWFVAVADRSGPRTKPPAATGAADTAAAAPAPLAVRLAPLSGGRRRGWERTRPSGLEGGTTVSLGHLLAPSRSAVFARGQLIHAWFEQVLWLDDGTPAEDQLAAVARKVLAQEAAAAVDLAAELARFQARLASPPVADVLSRRRYDDLERVGFPGPVLQQLRTRRLRPLAQNERGFAIRDGAQLLTGFIDRLVLLEDGGQVVAAEIIDFKTDLLDGGDAQQRADKVAFYAPQLRAYQRAVSQLAHCPPERIVATLLFVEAGIVATVT